MSGPCRLIEFADRISGMGSCEYSITLASTFVSSAAYTGVSVKRCLDGRGAYRGNESGMSTGSSAVRSANRSKSVSFGGSSSS